jgi:hypothetical protein
MNAAIMSLELHERGIHAVRPGAGVAGVTGDRSPARRGRLLAVAAAQRKMPG